jgi:SNF2 family DNA or RNA helicase
MDIIVGEHQIELRNPGFVPRPEFMAQQAVIKTIASRKFIKGEKESHWVFPADALTELKQKFPKANYVEGRKPRLAESAIQTMSLDLSLVAELKVKPFPFQLVGVNFLVTAKKCLLGDTMGLGKTFQLMTAAYALNRQKPIRVLVVCPAPLKYQWHHEIAKFLAGVTSIVIDGTPKKRQKQYWQILEDKITFTLVNYELVRQDIDVIETIPWDVIILDEAQKIKERTTQTFQTILRLAAEYQWAATGTPVQNRPDELYNIFEWINPAILGKKKLFLDKYCVFADKWGRKHVLDGYKNLHVLHQEIAPYTIRRLTNEVVKDLPALTITNQYVEMTADQVKAHRIIEADAKQLMEEINAFNRYDMNGELISKHPRADYLQGMFIMMQEVADCPELLAMSDSGMAQKYLKQFKDLRSSKVEATVELVISFLDEDPANKIVIFSRFERMQGILKKALEAKHKKDKPVQCLCISGKLDNAAKEQVVRQFSSDTKMRILIGSDSINYGVNLQIANLIIQFDLPMNPAVYHQRNGRIQRIGTQHHHLDVINMIALDSTDEKILAMLERKQSLSDQIVEKTGADTEKLNLLNIEIARQLL